MPDLRLVDPDGVAHVVPEGSVPAALQSGWRAETQSDVSRDTAAAARETDYGGGSGAVKAALYGAARGATLGASDVAFRALGANAKDLSGLRTAHPTISTGAEFAGTLLPAIVAPESLLGRTPAGALSRVAMDGVEAGRAAGGVGGLATSLAASGLEGAGQSAGAYLSDVALGDRKLSAEGVAGALGGGFVFGAAGGGVALGVEKGAIAAKRLFAHVADGGAKAANEAEQAWRTQYQSVIESHDAAIDAARAQLASARSIREQAGLARDRASAATADIRAIAPDLDAAHAAATGLDQKIATIEAASHPAVKAGGIDDLERLVSEHAVARSELDDVLRRIDESSNAELLPYAPTPGVPTDEFGPRRSGRIDHPTIDDNPIPASSMDVTNPGRPASNVQAPRIEVVRVGSPSARKFEARASDGTVTPIAKGEMDAFVESQMPPGFKAGAGVETHRNFSIEHGIPTGDIPENSIHIVKPSELAQHGINGNEIHPEHDAEMAKPWREKMAPIEVRVKPDGQWYIEDGNHRLQQAAKSDMPVAVNFKKVGSEWEPQKGTRDITDRLRTATGDGGSDASLTSLLRGTQEKLAAGESINAIGAQGRGEYAAAKAGKRQQWMERNAPMAADEAAANASVPTMMTNPNMTPSDAWNVLRSSGPVDDIARVAPAITKYERKSAELVEALGDAAPPMAKEQAAAFRAAEDDADRKMIDRTTRAVDDGVGVDRRPSANLPSKQRLESAKRDQMKANAAYQNARVGETEAKIGVRNATDARNAIPAPPTAPTGAAPSSLFGNMATAVGVAGELGVPGIPSARDIPVIGPLLSMYIKYRALKATVGRFVGRVSASGDSRAASLAARTKDRIATAIDRSLGLIATAAPKTRGVAVAASAAIGRRIFDDGEPDAGKDATPQQQAAVRIREIVAANTRPELISAMVRREMHGVADPDLIAAAEQHLIARFSHLASVIPNPPPDNEYAKRPWVPSTQATHELNQRLAVIHDPEHGLTARSPAAADTFRTAYPLLYELAKNRLIQRVGDMTEAMSRAERLRVGALFQLPIDISLDPSHIAIVRAPAKPDVQPPAPVGMSVDGISKMYSPTRI